MTARDAEEKFVEKAEAEANGNRLVSNCEYCKFRILKERTPNGNETDFCTKWKRFIGNGKGMINDSEDCTAVTIVPKGYKSTRALKIFIAVCVLGILFELFFMLGGR